MIATLRFDLRDEDDKSRYESAMNGLSYELILFELLNQFIRSKVKYESDQHSEDYLKALEDVREFIVSEATEHNVLKNL